MNNKTNNYKTKFVIKILTTVIDLSFHDSDTTSNVMSVHYLINSMPELHQHASPIHRHVQRHHTFKDTPF